MPLVLQSIPSQTFESVVLEQAASSNNWELELQLLGTHSRFNESEVGELGSNLCFTSPSGNCDACSNSKTTALGLPATHNSPHSKVKV